MRIIEVFCALLVLFVGYMAWDNYSLRQEFSGLEKENLKLIDILQSTEKSIAQRNIRPYDEGSNSFSSFEVVNKESQLTMRNDGESADVKELQEEALIGEIEFIQAEEINGNLEGYDEDWKITKESQIYDAFFNHEYLNKMQLDEISCEKTTCEIVIGNSEVDVHDSSLTVLFALKELNLVDENLERFHRGNRLDNGTYKITISKIAEASK